jgi:hypothetical protein
MTRDFLPLAEEITEKMVDKYGDLKRQCDETTCPSDWRPWGGKYGKCPPYVT